LDTVEFFPRDSTLLTLTPIETAVIAADALMAALQQKKLPANLAKLHEPSNSAIQQLMAIYKLPSNLLKQPTASLAPSPRVEPVPRVHATTSQTPKPIHQHGHASNHRGRDDLLTTHH
jgi:hypothetical protein